MGRKSKAKVRRQEILFHFYEVIIEEGFEGASIAKIAKKMDVNPSLLIHYFKNKDKMVLGLIDYIIETYSAQILPDFSTVEDPQERWDDLVDVVSRIQWNTFLNTTVYYSAYTLGFRNDEIKERFVQLYQGVSDRLQHEIEIACSKDIINVKNPKAAAKFMLTLMEGANYFQNVDPEFTGDQDDLEERSKMIKETINQMVSTGTF
ncbi:MAG: TetR/AcrR family transcriptional regulator [Bacteroidota bacterium]